MKICAHLPAPAGWDETPVVSPKNFFKNDVCRSRSSFAYLFDFGVFTLFRLPEPFSKLVGLVMLVLTFTGCQSLKPTPLPAYLSVDLTLPYSQNEQRVQPLNEVPYPIPEIYKTDKLLLKHVPAQGDQSGFYMTVFEVTERQHRLLLKMANQKDERWVGDLHPARPHGLLETTVEQPNINSDSVLSSFIRRTGLPFSLPSEKQWLSAFDTPSESSHTKQPIKTSTLPVGSFSPNGKGFYDMNTNGTELTYPELSFLGCAYFCLLDQQRAEHHQTQDDGWGPPTPLMGHPSPNAQNPHRHNPFIGPRAYRLTLPEEISFEGFFYVETPHLAYLVNEPIPVKATLNSSLTKSEKSSAPDDFEESVRIITDKVSWQLSDGTPIQHKDGALYLTGIEGATTIIGSYKSQKAYLYLELVKPAQIDAPYLIIDFRLIYPNHRNLSQFSDRRSMQKFRSDQVEGLKNHDKPHRTNDEANRLCKMVQFIPLVTSNDKKTWVSLDGLNTYGGYETILHLLSAKIRNNTRTTSKVQLFFDLLKIYTGLEVELATKEEWQKALHNSGLTETAIVAPDMIFKENVAEIERLFSNRNFLEELQQQKRDLRFMLKLSTPQNFPK